MLYEALQAWFDFSFNETFESRIQDAKAAQHKVILTLQKIHQDVIEANKSIDSGIQALLLEKADLTEQLHRVGTFLEICENVAIEDGPDTPEHSGPST